MSQPPRLLACRLAGNSWSQGRNYVMQSMRVIHLPGLSRRGRMVVLVICCSSLFIVGLDSTIVNVAPG